jgi:PhzF family phenazine biosynthesis protein
MKIETHIINAFSYEGKGGNPAAVVLDSDRLDSRQKQAIAAKIGLSETVFVGTSQKADFKLDFFTPTMQIAHCGHATIAAFYYLRQLGRATAETSVKETIDGNREIRFIGEKVYMEQRAPKFSNMNATDQITMLRSLGLPIDYPNTPVLVDTGNVFAIQEVETEQVLAGLVPDMDSIAKLSRKYGLIGFYVFCRSSLPGIAANARMFAPAYGINEEAATGMAAGPLACYLFAYGHTQSEIRISQGIYMSPPSPSLITVLLNIDDSRITGLYVGGSAVLTNTSEVEI